MDSSSASSSHDYHYKFRQPILTSSSTHLLNKPIPPPPPPSIHRLYKHKPLRPPPSLRGPSPPPLSLPSKSSLTSSSLFHSSKLPVLPPSTFHRTIPSSAVAHLKSPPSISSLWKSGPPTTVSFHHAHPHPHPHHHHLSSGVVSGVSSSGGSNEFHPSISDFHQPLKSSGLFPGGMEDDKGPIHTIPAPNLNPLDKANVGKPQLLNLPHSASQLFAKPVENDLSSISLGQHHNTFLQHQQQQQHVDLSSFKKIPSFSTSLYGTTQHHLNSIHYNKKPSNGYKVHEDSNDEVNSGPDGTPQYYAPDPDPSLPAPKTPLTLDPHSLPSNGKPLPPDVEHTAHSQPPLTSQELYQLLHIYPQKISSSDLHAIQPIHDNQASLSLIEPHGNIHPQFHTFNYVEQYDSTKQPSAPGFAQPDFHEYNIVARDNSANEVSKLSVRHTSVNEDVIGSEDSSGNHYFTELPNKNVADAFAALQAAGNIKTNLISKHIDNYDKNININNNNNNNNNNDNDDREYNKKTTEVVQYHREVTTPQMNEYENGNKDEYKIKINENQQINGDEEHLNEEEEGEDEEEVETLSPTQKFIEDLQRRQKENRERELAQTARRREQMLQERRQQQLQRYRQSMRAASDKKIEQQETSEYEQHQHQQQHQQNDDNGDIEEDEEDDIDKDRGMYEREGEEEEEGEEGEEEEEDEEEKEVQDELEDMQVNQHREMNRGEEISEKQKQESFDKQRPFRGSVKFGSRLTKRNRHVF